MDPIKLVMEETPAARSGHGGAAFTLTDNGRVVVKAGHPIEELFDQKPPDGKRWEVTVHIYVKETDA